MSLLRRCGIPGPKPNLFFGNIFHFGKKSMIDKQKELIQKYGKVVGYYTGEKTIVIVADPELAKNIMIKDFYNFTDRSQYLRDFHPSHLSDGSLLKARGFRWKRIRSLLSPAFTAKKLKDMTPLVDEAIESLLTKFDDLSATGQASNVYVLYQRLSAEVVVKTAFGFKIDAQNDPDNVFLKAADKALAIKYSPTVFFLSNCLKSFHYLFHPIRALIDTIGTKYNLSPTGTLWVMASKMIEIRKRDPSLRRNDLLQAMIDSYLTKEDMAKINEGIHISNYTQDNKSMILTEAEIKTNCSVFYSAGYDTTSTGLAYVTHLLANYPEIQEKVRQEVFDIYEREGELNFNAVNELNYMEMVFNESLRLYPPIITGSTRECLADYRYKDITIPKGTMVSLCTYYMHHDPEYWPEPEQFDPERFSLENRHVLNSGSYQAFGNGPRNCIGIRLAYFEMKFTLAKILLKYRFERCPSTESGRLQTKCKLVSMVPKNGVFVKVVKI